MMRNHTSSTSFRQTALARMVVSLAAVTLPFTALAQSPSLSLEQTLTNLRATPDWQSADLAYQTAQRALETAQAATGLNLSASGGYGFSQVTSQNATANNSLSVSVTASVNVLPWSPAQDQLKSAQRSLEQAERTRRNTRNTLRVTTTSTYFEARSSSLDVRVASANQALQEGRLRAANQRYQNGQIALTDVLDAQANLASAQSNLLLAQNTLAINLATLGVPSGTVLPSTPQTLELPSGAIESLVQAAMLRRADVQNAASKVVDAEDAVANARRDRLVPNASLSLGYGQLTGGQLTSPSLSGSLNVQSGVASVTGSYPVVGGPATTTTGYTVSVSASIPVIAPSSDARINAAETNLELARTNLESARRSAALDVAGRYGDATTAQARLRVSQASLETARKTLEAAQARSQAGLISALDLESARVNLAAAERDLERAQSNAFVAALRLQNALGLEPSIAEGAAR